MTPITDQGARDAILADLDRTLFVEAGAGSGKTTALVGRLVALVLAGVDVTEVAAITFTEAAAAELRARVREALESVAAGHAIRGVDVDADSPRLARAALDDLDRATISTLHSFAQQLLAAAPVESSLPPRVEVHDEISSALRTRTRWAGFVADLIDDDDLSTTVRAALALGISVDHLESVTAMLNQNWDLLVDIDLGVERATISLADVTLPIDGVLDAAETVLAMADACPDQSDKLCLAIRKTVPAQVAMLEAAVDPFVALEVSGARKTVPRNVGKAENWPDGGKAKVHEVWTSAIETLDAARVGVTDRVLRRLGAELAAYTLREADVRRAEGRLEFHDLLVLARAVLRGDESVRRRMHARYRRLLIDEFQDTDPIQVELAVRIAADPGHDPSTPWDEVEIEPGRLFFVGDPKQSIYRFRRADIDLFARAGDRHHAGSLRLDTNFRTVAPILVCCNEVFGRLIVRSPAPGAGDEGHELTQPDYAPLSPARSAIPADPGPPVVFVGAGEPDASADSLRRAEANDIVAALVRAQRDRWLVHPADDETPRPCRWDDMAVLVPSRTSLPHLRRALEDASVPYRLETGSLVYATTEIRDVLSVLRAIDDPGDAVSVVGALRSPAYGCGDDDLLAWHRSVGTWSYQGVDDAIEAAGPEQAVPVVVADAMRDLQHWHARRTFDRIPELIDGVIRARSLMASSLAGGRHRDAWRLYRVLVEHARLFADVESGGLSAFLTWAELQSDDKLRVTVPVLPEADVDAVRVMTIHGAKGLEFGITAVSGLSGQFPSARRGPQVRFQPEGGFDIRLGTGLETGRFDARRTVEDVMDAHEGIRLLYVALTRARDHLIVSLHHKPSDAVRCHGQRLAEAVAGLGWSSDTALVGVEVDPGSSSRKVDHADGGSRTMRAVEMVGSRVTPEAQRAWVDTLERWDTARAAVLSLAATGGATSATALSRAMTSGSGPDPVVDHTNDGDTVDVDGHPEPWHPEPWQRGRLGTSVGSAVHAVLQHADLTDPDGTDLAALARWQAEVEGIPDAGDAIEASARSGLQSALVTRAVRSGRWWRELHVGVPAEDIVGSRLDGGPEVFEGFIDLAFETADGLVVVDYKTDAVADQDAVDRAVARYRYQGAAYAVALEAATGRPVVEVHLLFLRAQGAVDALVTDLETRCDEVRAALARSGLARSGLARSGLAPSGLAPSGTTSAPGVSA